MLNSVLEQHFSLLSHIVLFHREIFPCLLTLVKCLKSALYRMLFSPLFIHKVHTYFNSELGFIMKTKGFLNTKRLCSYESMKQTLCLILCARDDTVPRGKGKSHPPTGSGDGKAGQSQALDQTRSLISIFAPPFGALISTSHTVSWSDHSAESIFICIWQVLYPQNMEKCYLILSSYMKTGNRTAS